VRRRTQYSVLSTQYVILSITMVVLAGCQPRGDGSSRSITPDKVKLVRGDAKALEELVAKHKGEVVLVDYWAMWCGPCVENFPHTVQMATKFRQQGLATVAVNFDLLEDEPKVREFLAKSGADFENVISSHDAIGQKPAEDFDIGPLPEYRLYDRQGKLSQKWEGTAPGEELTKKIEELLAQ
jgi:thiol-disulfide isomerase/thioredoxin